jgi:hypothetical protein
MWLLKKRINTACEGLRDALERTPSRADAEGVIPQESLLAHLPENARKHFTQCSQCRSFADELLEVRAMLESEQAGSPSRPQPGPYFLTRVMAAITDRQAELDQRTQTWAAVPRLAHRVSALASLTLLIAGSWLYQQPRHPSAQPGIGTEQNSEGLVEGGANAVQDDFLLNAADR